jgi:hypothetical protein
VRRQRHSVRRQHRSVRRQRRSLRASPSPPSSATCRLVDQRHAARSYLRLVDEQRDDLHPVRWAS